MRSAQSPSIDFNQMLVFSVFFHFFLFTVVMFLPQTQEAVRRIKPAFMVSFVDIPAGPDRQPAPLAKETSVAPLPPVKPIPQKAKPVPEKPPPSKVLSKLDELARLEKMKTIPKKDKMAMAVPKPKESVLKDFEKMKLKTTAEKKPTRKVIAKDDLALEEMEFDFYSKKSATLKPESKPRKKSSLIKELNKLDEQHKKDHAALDKLAMNKTDSKANELFKQMESIKKGVLKIDKSKLTSQQTEKFKATGLLSVKLADHSRKTVSPAASGESGDPAANALSLYLGKVQIQINEQWKNPAGGGSGKVQVSFKIFPTGKIEKPEIKKGSGVSKLDNLAIRAINEAAPLPPFPKEIREPNLPLTFEFTYEPSKK